MPQRLIERLENFRLGWFILAQFSMFIIDVIFELLVGTSTYHNENHPKPKYSRDRRIQAMHCNGHNQYLRQTESVYTLVVRGLTCMHMCCLNVNVCWLIYLKEIT